MTESYFFVGIGGSGMLPLAQIVRARGAEVAGSDRAYDGSGGDEGRGDAKFDRLRDAGIALFAQDGSGLTSVDQIVVASAAIEDSVPDIARARALGCRRVTRAELLADLFNAAPLRIAVGGTSGKSTVTGMIGWILSEAGADPTIMNGAVMKNFAASARVGGGAFVSEVDESDGSIALYLPTVAVLNNVAVDHKPIEELRGLFGGFLAAADVAVVNADNAEAAALLSPPEHPELVEGLSSPRSLGETRRRASTTSANRMVVRFGFAEGADLRATAVVERSDGVDFTLEYREERIPASLRVPGRHNVSNALAAIGAGIATGVSLANAARALASFVGLARRYDVVGAAGGVTVIDDFGHNPDKIAATLATAHAHPGRLLVFFQPHGYGPLRQMGRELADAFNANLRDGDRLIVSDPAYFGGTVDRSIGSDALVAMIGKGAEHIAAREACGERLVELAQPGDRMIVMGARDDSLSVFARGLLEGIEKKGHPQPLQEGLEGDR